MTMYDPLFENAPKPPRRSHKLAIVLLCACAFAALVLVCGLGAAFSTSDHATSATGRPAVVVPQTHAAPTAAPIGLRAADLELTAKITKKDCFGSAGCNVEYRIVTAIDEGARGVLTLGGKTYEITYAVTGFDDGEHVGTLTIDPDGVTHQDGYQAGSTDRSSRKLKVKITDVQAML